MIATISLSVVSALLYFAAQPNELWLFGQPIVGLVCFIPLFLALYRVNGFWSAYAIGALFLAGSNLLITYWLANFGDFAIWTVLGVTIGYVIFFASTVMPILWFIYRRGSPIETSWLYRFRPLLVACVWVGYEYLKSNGVLAFPWALAAYPLNNVLPAIQVADLGGVYLVSFLIVLLQASLAEWVIGSYSRRILIYRLANMPKANLQVSLVLIVLALGYGGLNLLFPAVRPQTTFNAVLVQQNLDSWKEDRPDTILQLAQDLSRAAVKGRSLPDLTVWSETSIRFPVNENLDFYRTHPLGDSFMNFLAQGGAPLLSGAPHLVPGKDPGYGNTVVLYGAQAQELGWYAKQQLIPFAEYVPGWDIGFLRDFVERVIGLPSGGWRHGTTTTLLRVPLRHGDSVLAGAPICFEDALATIPADMARRGAQVLINLTNNAWSKTLSAQTQHFAAARFRAVETRLPLLRSTNGGLSCVVRPDGSLQAVLPMFQPVSMAVQVAVPNHPKLTAYVWAGDLFAFCCLIAGLGAVLWLGLIRPRLGHRSQGG
jgi:apolipoprotein N-acyltransferase